MTVFVFDLEGTLTPPRLPMTRDFAERFSPWLADHQSFVVTGAEYRKVEQQLSANIINAFAGIYSSMGNALSARGKTVYRKDFPGFPELFAVLEDFRGFTAYPGRKYSNYIERRAGMINFSVIGLDCPYEERLKYASWDRKAGERLRLQRFLQDAFPQLEVAIGGSISLDITPKGCGKGQVAHHLRAAYPEEEIVFFGDRTMPGGNDHELACELGKLDNTRTVQVSGPDEVLRLLGLA